MPVYDYVCNDCHKAFERTLTLQQHDGQKIKCPHCGGTKVEQAAAAFYPVTSKKTA
jgi:putative FmdB family regulatory protein